jgi:hypothetical protein
MLLFAAHDPGAKNNIRPVYEHALSLGFDAQFIDLATCSGLMDQDQAAEFIKSINLKSVILGCSSNQGEWPLIQACKALGIHTGMVVDIGTLTKIDSMTPDDFPSRFMVSNDSCHQEVLDLGAHPATVTVTGDCHLEVLSNLPRQDTSEQVRKDYGLPMDASVVSFFCSPNTQDTIDAIVSLAELLPTTDIDRPAVIVRPHPRSRHLEVLELVCQPHRFLRFDAEGHVSNWALLATSVFSMSMASTVTLESLVLGTPTAFFQVGWDFNELNHLYRNLVDVVRIRTENQLNEFVASAIRREGPTLIGNVENHKGALARTWRVVEELMAAEA